MESKARSFYREQRFPLNEIETTVTFVNRMVTRVITLVLFTGGRRDYLRVHHSLCAAPDDSYKPQLTCKKWIINISFFDYIRRFPETD